LDPRGTPLGGPERAGGTASEDLEDAAHRLASPFEAGCSADYSSGGSGAKRDARRRRAAAALCLAGLQVVVYWHGATLEAAFELRPSTLLLHEAVRDACAYGAAWFDLNPSAGLEGVREFKRCFGTQTLSCPVVVRQSTRTRGLRRLRGRRPDQS